MTIVTAMVELMLMGEREDRIALDGDTPEYKQAPFDVDDHEKSIIATATADSSADGTASATVLVLGSRLSSP